MTLDPKALLEAFRVNHHPDAEPSSVELANLSKSIEAYLAALSKEVQASEAVGWRDAAERLLSVFDEQALILQRIIVGGRSDTVLREEGNKAITDLRAALATPPDTDGTKMKLSDAQIKYMVDRFHRPVGTNLFDEVQADAMVRHMIDGIPDAKIRTERK